MMKKLTKYFFEGLIFLVPAIVTVYAIYFVFAKVDGVLRFEIPGLGFVVTIATITAIGFIASNLLTKRLVALVDRTVRRLPLVRMIYTSVKDLTGAFVGEKKRFDKPVLVRLSPGSEVLFIGFVTAENLGMYGLPESVAVYLPQSYNFAGNLIIVPREQVTPLRAESGQVMAFIVSGGVTGQAAED
ncbi:MAG: DUF502 domain-containing protein [Nitrospirota bacterium]|nr:DUF502 domain-containing protein [Nitrospirota bacterium]